MLSIDGFAGIIVGKSVGRTDLEEKVSSQYEFVF